MSPVPCSNKRCKTFKEKKRIYLEELFSPVQVAKNRLRTHTHRHTERKRKDFFLPSSRSRIFEHPSIHVWLSVPLWQGCKERFAVLWKSFTSGRKTVGRHSSTRKHSLTHSLTARARLYNSRTLRDVTTFLRLTIQSYNFLFRYKWFFIICPPPRTSLDLFLLSLTTAKSNSRPPYFVWLWLSIYSQDDDDDDDLTTSWNINWMFTCREDREYLFSFPCNSAWDNSTQGGFCFSDLSRFSTSLSA